MSNPYREMPVTLLFMGPNGDVDPFDRSFGIVNEILRRVEVADIPEETAKCLRLQINEYRTILAMSKLGELPSGKFKFNDFIDPVREDDEYAKDRGFKYQFGACLYKHFRIFFEEIDDVVKNLRKRGVLLDYQDADMDDTFLQVYFSTKKEGQEFLKRFETYLRNKKKRFDEAKEY